MNRVILFFCIFLVGAEVLAQGNEITVMKKRAATEAAVSIVVDSASGGAQAASTLRYFAWKHIVGSGSKRILVVSVHCNSAVDNFVDSIYYGSVKLTKIADYSNDTYERYTGIWALIAPASGSDSIRTYRNSINSRIRGSAISFTGVNQSGGASTFGTAASGLIASNDTLASTAVTTIAGDVVYCHYWGGNFVSLLSVNGTEVRVVTVTPGSGNGGDGGGVGIETALTTSTIMEVLTSAGYAAVGGFLAVPLHK
jgi:hypothetical protein